MRKELFLKLKEALFSVVPISVIVLLLAMTPLVDLSVGEIVIFALSALFLIVGIALFSLGADMAMTPMGTFVGSGLTKTKRVGMLLGVCFILGLLITIAEPDLTVLGEQVKELMKPGLLIAVVGVGVGLLLLVAVLKIVFKKDLSLFLLFFYLAVFGLSALLAEEGKLSFLPLAFDSGGVTTGPITVPFIMALGVGIANTIGGKGSNENSFGLVALCSVGPVLAVVLLFLFSRGELQYHLGDYSMQMSFGSMMQSLGRVALEVLRALGLIVLSFLVLQVTVLRLPKRRLFRIGSGLLYTFFGLVIFLTAVQVGYMPVGFKIGQQVASLDRGWIIALGFVFGMVVVLAEPAVHVLTKQVEEITNGAVSRKTILISLSVGVGIAIGLSMIRIAFGFSILYYLVPGYLIAMGLSLLVPKLYSAIAFDSGGVASGPLTSSFILPLGIGACSVMAGEQQILSQAFGIVAMVALAPLITIQFLGFRTILTARMRRRVAIRRIVSAEDEQIIYFSKKR